MWAEQVVEKLDDSDKKKIEGILKKHLKDIPPELEKILVPQKKLTNKKLVKKLLDLPKISRQQKYNILEELNSTLGVKPAGKLTLKELSDESIIKTMYRTVNNFKICPMAIDKTFLKKLIKKNANTNLLTFLNKILLGVNRNSIINMLKELNKETGATASLFQMHPRDLNETQLSVLYEVFHNMDYLSPPTDTVVPVGEKVLEKVIKEHFQPAFVKAVTRRPTTAKGLAFVVEAVIAYGGEIVPTSNPNNILYRYVNRTPKLRDNSDCAIWKAVTEVNWKNYKLNTSDNGMPTGPIRILVNVTGPFVHLMFKSQSKNALAHNETLIKEIKLALEEAGRSLKSYITKLQHIERQKKRASTLARYAETFSRSLANILKDDKEIKKPPTADDIFRLIKVKLDKEIEKDAAMLKEAMEEETEVEGANEEHSKIQEEVITVNSPGDS